MERDFGTRNSAPSQKSTYNTSSLMKVNYGTMTEFSRRMGQQDDSENEVEMPEIYKDEVSIHNAMNRIKNYRLFYLICI